MPALTQAEQTQRSARQARFKAEAKLGPPPLPKRQFAHAEKLVKTDPADRLAKLLARKAAAGMELTADQRRALETLGESQRNSMDSVAAAAPPPRKPIAAVPSSTFVDKPPASGRVAPSRRAITLRKKLHEIRVLEERVANDGAVLQNNQREKLAKKADLLAELEALEAAS